MRTLVFCFAVIALAGCAQTDGDPSNVTPRSIEKGVPACAECSASATSLVVTLQSLGAKCDFAPVNQGRSYRCQVHVPSYSLPVDIFVPPKFQNTEMTLVYFLHGWWTDPHAGPFDGVNGDFATFLAQASRNVLLIIPESVGKNETYAKDLDDAEKMSAFFSQLEKLISSAGVAVLKDTPRALAGHSGAYVQLGRMGEWAASGQVAQLKNLTSIGLFDTAYGYREGLVKFMDAMCAGQPHPSYFMVFNPADGSSGKRDANERILSELKTTHRCATANLVYRPDSSTTHVAFPRTYLSDFIGQILQ